LRMSSVRIMIEKHMKIKARLSAKYVGNTMRSVIGIDNSAQRLQLLRALISKVRECKEPLSTHGVSNALYGLQNMNSDITEVRKMLVACSEAKSRRLQRAAERTGD